ncbi:MAG: S-methylmethionine permease [Saezia sp.]
MAGLNNKEEDSQTQKQEFSFKRTMKTRHLIMLSLGGVIGPGLFNSSGHVIAQAGPFGTILAYLIGALVVYLVMLCLGELTVHMPETGAFHAYTAKFIGPATGYVVAWLYWLTWAVALGYSFIVAGACMQYWWPEIPIWIWCVIFCIIIFGVNIVSTRFFAESEFWFSIIKVLVIVAFILIGMALIFGVTPMQNGQPAPYFSNFKTAGMFPNGFMPIIMTMLAVNFAFSGTELIGIAAGETEDPQKTVPRAIRTTIVRLVIFYVGAIFVLAALLPMEEAKITASPFVVVLDRVGIPYAGGIMNFVILTAVLSSANSGLYASARMLWSLAHRKTIPAFLGKLNHRGVPFNAIIFSMLGGLLALFSYAFAEDTVYLILSSVSGLAVVAVWMSIAACQYLFRKQFIAQGHNVSELKYRTPFYPLVPILAFIMCFIACVGIAFDPELRPALYYGIPFIVICYIAYYVQKALASHKEEK